MSADNVPLLSMNVPPAVQFGASKNFHTHTEQQELDSAFLGYERRPWMQAKAKPNPHREREAITALLSTSKDNVDKLLEENISYRDLASLTDEDLELFGFAAQKERSKFLKMFALLPNQDPSYEYICNQNAAQSYNNQIIANASNHIMYLRSSLAATNYKLQVLPPEDVVVGDKRYASRFALEALNSVQSISDELSEDLRKLEQLASDANRKREEGSSTPAKERNVKRLYYTAIALGTACAWFWWWSKRSNSPTLENISVKI
ncbi:uncharacterized protein daed [Drosophila montana]|uniref:uncharacterized protein daed n=1 Tax=Drosophila montana TaxID=40370 RepID=UPI00313DB393